MHLKLYDVPIGTILKMEFTVGGKKFCFDIKIKDIKGTKVFTDVISVEGRVLGFNGGNVKPDLILYRKDKKPVVWKEVPLTYVKVKGVDCYLIKLENSGIEVNRRNCFRIPVGIEGKVRVGLNKTVINSTVKDISESGISVIMDELYGDLDKKNIHVVFKDDELKYDFSLTARVVRKEEFEKEKKVLYGCEFTSKNSQLGRYITSKQREELSKHTGQTNSSIPKKKKRFWEI